MRIMIRFAKEDSIRFVSHLDLMRAARRMFRRADLPLAYSEGYHPHPILSFAMALPVGASSDAEYMDLSLSRFLDPDRILSDLRDAAPGGMHILGVWEMNEQAPSLMAEVGAARWRLLFPRTDQEELESAVRRIIGAQTVMVEKNNGKKTSVVDIRPGIREICTDPVEGPGIISALLDAGSRNNIQPSSLADAILGKASLGEVIIHRTAMLNAAGIPLEEGTGVLYG